MKPKKRKRGIIEALSPELIKIIDASHKLVNLSKLIDWESIESKFSKYYSEMKGRPGKSSRLIVGLHFLKYIYNLSDEEVVSGWIENPYWQYFTGETIFQHKLPIHPTSMTKWRNRIKESDLLELLEETVKSGFKSGTIKESDVQKVNVDTTVQEKNVTYPSDIKLYYKLMEYLVKYSKNQNINLKQTYLRVGKKLIREYGGHIHASQYNRAAKKVKIMKTKMGRLYRDVERNLTEEQRNSKDFKELEKIYQRLLIQKKNSKNKIYSIHEPEVVCIAKGKQHKKYEFGNKSGFLATSKNNFILSCKSFVGNPYDGHTLGNILSIAEKIVGNFGTKIKEVVVDLGFRGHNYEGDAKVHIVKRKLKGLPASFKKFLKRRSAIEAAIGHMKRDTRLGKNYLKGDKGNEINTVLSACGHNMRLILAFLYFFLFSKWEKFQKNTIKNYYLGKNCFKLAS